MSAIKAITLAIGISILYCGLIYTGCAFNGAGHGSDFFGSAMLAPFSVISEAIWTFPAGLALWFIIGIILSLRHFTVCRIIAAAILILHYIGIAIIGFQTGWYDVGRVWNAFPIVVVGFLTVYIASQFFMWILILSKQPAIQSQIIKPQNI